jgi:hypothetical protein
MVILQYTNLALRFILELCVLVALRYWGFQTGKGLFLKIVLGIGTPLLIAVIWDQPIYPRAVKELYNNAGWWPERSEEDIAKMLNSSFAVGEWQRKCLGGFARAVTDNFF